MNIRPILLIAVVLVLAGFRALPHAPNFTPVIAMALFAGMYFKDSKWALFAPLAVMLISDLFIGFHNTMPFVYGSLLLVAWMNRGGLGKSAVSSVALGAPLSAALFFLITTFGVWMMTGLYPMTGEGLMNSYAMALPFFKNTLISTLVYSAASVAAFEALSLKLVSKPSL